ncbi:MAG: formyl transferase [Deltaproteobacteria bacterium]|nr:formyl transferase [Deltaproteobacteria bacterium]
MPITPIFSPAEKGRPLKVAGFMSGSGTNILKLLDLQKSLESEDGNSPFKVLFLFSDRSDGACTGERIACEAGIPYFSHDIRAFHRLRGIPRSVSSPEGLQARKGFDKVALKLVTAFDIDVIALGGYMSFITLGRGVNVHPGDLSLLDSEGKRKYVGDHAVLDAIAAGETELRSSTLWTDQGVDTGPLLMVSAPLSVTLPLPLESLMKERDNLHQVANEHQERLKKIGDWNIFPRTFELIARGRFALDEKNRVYLDGRPVPQGYREQ